MKTQNKKQFNLIGHSSFVHFSCCLAFALIIIISGEASGQTPQSGIINPINTGHYFAPLYICLSQLDSFYAANLGTTPLTLKQIDIITQPWSKANQFVFDNGTQSLSINTFFDRGKRMWFHINFHPTDEAIDSAIIRVTWDSAGVRTLYSSNNLIGTGIVERETIEPSQQLHTAKTEDSLEMKINLSRDLDVSAGAMGMTFSINYSPSLLALDTSRLNEYDLTLSNALPPAFFTDSFGNQNILFTLKSQNPITELKPILTLHFKVIGFKDTTTSVTLSNPIFWGQNPQDTLYYFRTTANPANIQITAWEDSSANNLLSNIKIIANDNKQVVLISNNLEPHDLRIRIFSFLGAEVSSWQGTVAGYTRKVFTLPVAGFYFIAIQLEGKEYYFPRVID